MPVITPRGSFSAFADSEQQGTTSKKQGSQQVGNHSPFKLAVAATTLYETAVICGELDGD